jgi:flavin reductase (DIM6/NTAB) family NADH-FMN oxidoreductase RutF
MQHLDYQAIAGTALKQIEKGAFLTVQSGDTVNVMTIGWASIGFVWGRPMMTVLVRKTRYTFGLIEKSAEFSVSVPLADMKRELEICGTQSGRKVNKIEKCGFDLFPGEKIKTPIINIPGIHFECRIVCRSPIDPALLVDKYKHLYPEKDFHTIYFGEIVYCYSNEEEAGKKNR